jgi:uncharacterized sporulation protein YeaH/YhbH (DUF444 family)
MNEKKDITPDIPGWDQMSPEQRKLIRLELEGEQDHRLPLKPNLNLPPEMYDWFDLAVLQGLSPSSSGSLANLKTLDELMEKDKQREKDGFPKRIKIGRIVKPSKNKKDQIVVVPTTTEPKFYHDKSVTDEEETSTGGSGEGEEGEVIGEQQAAPGEGEGGDGAGQGKDAEHDVSSEAFDLGRILTEEFALPNLKIKGKKRSFTKYTYDLTDRNRGFGQVLDKKETLRKIIQTNALLGNIKEASEVSTEDLIISPGDKIYRILSKEKEFETQAMVFFLRDYSGSMQGKPTEIVSTQHLFIYSWLVYQYKNNVETRFILHDTTAKEVPDFYTYHNSIIAGGTNVYPAYELVNQIVEREQLAKDYNIYVFHGTDGDDWESSGEKAIAEIKKILTYCSRMGITIARNAWGGPGATVVEKYLEASWILKERPETIRMDSMVAAEAGESRIIEGIKKLIS